VEMSFKVDAFSGQFLVIFIIPFLEYVKGFDEETAANPTKI